MPLALDVGSIDIWMIDLSRPPFEMDCLAEHDAILSEQERKSCDRFVFQEHRTRYMAAHALLRLTLSSYFDVMPGDWRFCTNRYGRPELVAGQTDEPLYFNLSYAHGLVACAVTGIGEVGVDVEWVDRDCNALDIARRFFCKSEVEDLAHRSPAQQRERFFEYWTLKEAYLKALGVGLHHPLDGIAFDIDAQGRIGATIAGENHRGESHWSFHAMRPTSFHILSVAVLAQGDCAVTPKIHWTSLRK
jgi:4'-phosphopantetheinyl transferase